MTEQLDHGIHGPPGERRAVTVAFAAIVVAMLPAVLDHDLATALPTIAADLGRLTDVSWVITAATSSAPRRALPCGASSVTVTAGAGCSRSRWRRFSPRRPCAAPRRA